MEFIDIVGWASIGLSSCFYLSLAIPFFHVLRCKLNFEYTPIAILPQNVSFDNNILTLNYMKELKEKEAVEVYTDASIPETISVCSNEGLSFLGKVTFVNN